MVGVAKRPKAPDCGSGIRGFEFHHPPHKKQEISSDISYFYMLLGNNGIQKHDTTSPPWWWGTVYKNCKTLTIYLFLNNRPDYDSMN